MGRVDIRSSQRESIIVRHRHEAYIEEQPGVSNRNHYDSRPRRNHTVISEAHRIVCLSGCKQLGWYRGR